ncbi:hypothetical protein D3C78_972680 [compost metagenome]
MGECRRGDVQVALDRVGIVKAIYVAHRANDRRKPLGAEEADLLQGGENGIGLKGFPHRFPVAFQLDLEMVVFANEQLQSPSIQRVIHSAGVLRQLD